MGLYVKLPLNCIDSRAMMCETNIVYVLSKVEKHGRHHEDLTTMVEEPIGKQQVQLFS